MKRLIVFLLCVAAPVLLRPVGTFAQNVGLNRQAEEILLVDLEEFNTAAAFGPELSAWPPGTLMTTDMKVSPNLRHVVITVLDANGKWRVVLDGKMHEKYDGLGGDSLKFSPDGERLAYSAMNTTDAGTEEWLVVVDGEFYGPYKGITNPLFSPDSKHIAYFAGPEDKFFLVRDMVEDRSWAYDDEAVSMPVYSPDSSRLAFAAMMENKAFIVVDGTKGPEFDVVGNLSFSKDSRRFAYGARQGEKSFLVIDGVKSPPYDGISVSFFSPDSKHVCYCMKRGDKWIVVADGKEDPPYDDLSFKKWYSPDSKKLAYWAREGKKQFMVIESIPKPIPGIAGMPGTVIFSPDGQRMAWVIGDEKKKKVFVIVDDTTYGPYLGVNDPQFSPDSSRIAVMAMAKKNKWHIALDGIKGKTYTWVGDLCFSPNSEHVVYAGRDNKNWYVVLDGKEIASYKEVGSFVFSPDSQHLVHWARDKNNKQTLVVDGVEGKKYDSIFHPPTPEGQMSQNLVFDTPDSFHYLAFEGSRVYLVTEKLRE